MNHAAQAGEQVQSVDGRSTPSTQRSIHPIVRVTFLLRITTFPLFMLLYGVHLWGKPVPAWAIALFLAHGLAFPHLAWRVASRSADSKRAEWRNLLVDAFLIGCYIPLTGFTLWPNAASILAINAGSMTVGGPRAALRCLCASVIGATMLGFVTGFHGDINAWSVPTEIISVATIFAFTTMFSLSSYVQARKVTRSNYYISDQNARIAESTLLLERQTVDLEIALAEAEAANAAKSSFLANMSHELRTPLNSVIGFTKVLMRNKARHLSPQELVYLQRAHANGTHLLTLIDGVLDLSKIEAHQTALELVPVNLVTLIRETLAEIEPQAEGKPVRLVAEIPFAATLIADRVRLKQIIINLVGNALKFTNKGQITLRVAVDPTTGAPVQLDVIDTGVGIPPERLGVIFEAFQQADTTTARHYGGTGLGLTITRSVAQLMGWRIGVTSVVGVGSTFSVFFDPRPLDELTAEHEAHALVQPTA
jgi:signal transduction histidine kinase